MKRCPCGALFPIERNGRGQITTRVWCDACRRLNADQRFLRDRPEVPPGTPRCADCGALVGLHLGSTVTGLDEAGRCAPCADWARRRAEREPPWRPPVWPRRRADGLLPVNAAADLYGIKRSTLYGWIRQGLVGVELGAGGVRYVRRDEVLRARRARA